MRESPANRGLGVYGLAVYGLGDSLDYAGPAVAGSPRLNVRREVGTAPGAVSRLYDDRAVIPLLNEGVLEITRDPPDALYRHPHPLSDDEMLHPWLVPAAATVSAWHGRRVLHGGVVSNGELAVAVVGDKEGGKSTLLAHIALSSSMRIMSDDLVVFDDDTVFAGPSCIDLRPGSVPHLSALHGAVPVRQGTRLRMRTPKGPSACELAGIVVLRWSDEVGLRLLAPSERLPTLLPNALTEGVPLGRDGVLGFARYRVWELSRPRRWESLTTSADMITRLLW